MKLISVKKEHFSRAALEIGHNGENDALPYDVDAAFIRDKSDELSEVCIALFIEIEKDKSKDRGEAKRILNSLDVFSERLLAPSGAHGFRVITKINPFWNLYLDGLAISIAEANEPLRSQRAHSYWLSKDQKYFFDKSRSWRAYKKSTIEENALLSDGCVVVQADISGFYEHIYHHRLENRLKDLSGSDSNIPLQIDRIMNKISSGRSFGLPVGGQCARVLAEALLTPIDDFLSDNGVVWHRYVDDFTLICKSQQDSYVSLSKLSKILSIYGLSLNKTKTTIMSGRHYKDYVEAQLGSGDDSSAVLREIDLHFDPYSDAAQEDYKKLQTSFAGIDVQFLLDLEKEKSQPDGFIMAQIGRALKFQEPAVAAQLCSTLLDSKNIDTFRASWSKIMRGVYSVRVNDDYKEVHQKIDFLLDEIINNASHLLVSESNLLHFLKVIAFSRTPARGVFLQQVYNNNSSKTVKRACIDIWRRWKDRPSFLSCRDQWSSLAADEQRMFWLAAASFGDEGMHAKIQLRHLADQSWRLGFEKSGNLSFAKCYKDWAENGH